MLPTATTDAFEQRIAGAIDAPPRQESRSTRAEVLRSTAGGSAGSHASSPGETRHQQHDVGDPEQPIWRGEAGGTGGGLLGCARAASGRAAHGSISTTHSPGRRRDRCDVGVAGRGYAVGARSTPLAWAPSRRR